MKNKIDNKEELISTIKYIIKNSESQEEAFETIDDLFYEVLTVNDLIQIILSFLEDTRLESMDEEICIGQDLRVVH
jgi:transcriptional regulator CtsR